MDAPLPGVLDRLGVNLLYIDEGLWQKLHANPVHYLFLTFPEFAGWKILAYQNSESGKWMLMYRHPNAPRTDLVWCASTSRAPEQDVDWLRVVPQIEF